MFPFRAVTAMRVVLIGLTVALFSCSLDSAASHVRFLAVGDTGSGEAPQREVAAAMKTVIDSDGADFIVFLGDNFYPTGVSSVADPQWLTKYETIYGVWGLPVYAALGNHDYGGNGAGTEYGKGAIEVEYTSHSTTWKMPGRSYQFDRNPASLFVLDTNTLKMNDTDILNQGAAIDAWSTSGWKIVVGHHPYRSNGPHGNAGDWDSLPASPPTTNGAYFLSFFQGHVLGKADLYLCGHDHSLQVLSDPANRRPLLVVSGAGGETPTALAGTNPSDFQAAASGFVAVDCTRNRLDLRVFDSTAQLLYETTLTR